jgi:hypothetical protein
MEIETDDQLYIESLSGTDVNSPLKVETGYMFESEITESNYNH